MVVVKWHLAKDDPQTPKKQISMDQKMVPKKEGTTEISTVIGTTGISPVFDAVPTYHKLLINIQPEDH